MPGKFHWIRNIYLYLVCAITLFMFAFAAVELVNLALRTWVFTKADQMNYAYPVKTPDGYCSFAKDGNRVCPPAPAEELQKINEQNKKQADENRAAQRQNDLVRNISMLIIAIPLFAYHWFVIRRDKKNED